MALNVDDEIRWLTTEILPLILKNGRLIENYSASQLDTFKVGDIKIALIGTEEAFMMTQCYRAQVNFEYAGAQYQHRLVVKKTPELPKEIYAGAQFDDLFHNEISFYTEILPLIKKLSDGKFAAPRYYHSELRPNFALLILGDFGVDGWSLAKDRYALSLEHARIAVKYLGKFHGFGYALKHNEKERFEKISSGFRDSRYASDTVPREFDLVGKASMKRASIAVNKYHPQVDQDFVKKFQKLALNGIKYGRQRVAPKEPLSTLCHGDFLRNNVAYKYDTNNNGTPLDMMMFDYQTMRLSSPMLDLSTFLANSIFSDVRHKNFNSIFDDYCNALFESYTTHSNQELPDFLSRNNLLKEYIRFLPYSVSISAFFLMALVEPSQKSMAELLSGNVPDEEIIEDTMNQGGEVVNREIAHQIWEMYELSRLHNIEIDGDIDTKDWVDNVGDLDLLNRKSE